MSCRIRPIQFSDLNVCGCICYHGYKTFYDKHGFPSSFATIEAAIRRIQQSLEHPHVFGVVAEDEGKVVGFNFLTEMDFIKAIGPIVIDPSEQGRGVGRNLMNALLDRARGSHCVRLVTAAYNFQSLPLYTSVGFSIVEPLLTMVGKPKKDLRRSGYEVRAMTSGDLAGCDALHERVHGFSRGNELRERFAARTAIVALRDGYVAAYLASPRMISENHGVAETTEAMIALLSGAADIIDGPLVFLMPSRQDELLRWCLESGFRLANAMVLMNRGDYKPPQGIFIPTILY